MPVDDCKNVTELIWELKNNLPGRWFCKYWSVSKDGQLCVNNVSTVLSCRAQYCHNSTKIDNRKTWFSLNHFNNLEIWWRVKQMCIILFTEIHWVFPLWHICNCLFHFFLYSYDLFLWNSACSKIEKSCYLLHYCAWIRSTKSRHFLSNKHTIWNQIFPVVKTWQISHNLSLCVT